MRNDMEEVVLNSKYYPGIFPERLRKVEHCLGQSSRPQKQIRSREVLNTDQECLPRRWIKVDQHN
jgi:hypothetical protein